MAVLWLFYVEAVVQPLGMYLAIDGPRTLECCDRELRQVATAT